MLLPLADGFLGWSGTQLLALLVSGVALVYAITRWRRNVMRKARQSLADEPTEREATSTSFGGLKMHEVTAELQALLAEIEETARRVTAQIDNRYARLEQLLAEADEKIARLEAALGASGKPDAAQNIAVVSDAQRTLTRLRQERGAPPADKDPAYQPVYTLADRGKSSREIAQELGRQPGEIELILALRQRQSSS